MDQLSLILVTEKTGGLFDLDGTLPLIAIQFLVLMFLLKVILYTPLLALMEEREKYIQKNLGVSEVLLSSATDLTTKYESEIAKAKNQSQVEISTLQKQYKNVLETELRSAQKTIDMFLVKVQTSFENKKDRVVVSLEKDIDSLSTKIISKLLS